MKNINFAIIGFGGIAKTHAIGAYTANLTLKLPYSLNLTHTLTRKPLALNMSGCVNCQNIQEVLENTNIDFIDICTPNDSHKEILEMCANYNKTVYCEKPLAANYKEAFNMYSIVKKAEIRNATALMYRFMPAIRLIKNEIEEGSIGEIIDFKINLYHKSYLDPNKKGSWRTQNTSGGGALLDLGVHLVDIVYFTLGEIEKIRCTTKIFFTERTNMDEIATCNLKLKNGVNGSMEVSRIYADSVEPTTYVLYGSKGSIRMSSDKPYVIEVYNYNNNLTEIKSAKGVNDILDFYPPERASLGSHQDCHAASIVNFANEIFTGNSNVDLTPTFEDALRAQRVIEACYLSSKENSDILVENI
jgi:predicted dehydrogenase